MEAAGFVIGYDHNLPLSKYNSNFIVDRVNICAELFIHRNVNQMIDCSEILSRLPFLILSLGSSNDMVLFFETGRTFHNINYACKLVNVCDIFHVS